MIALDETNELSGRCRSPDGFEETHGLEGFVGRTAQAAYRSEARQRSCCRSSASAAGKRISLSGTVGSFFFEKSGRSHAAGPLRQSTSARNGSRAKCPKRPVQPAFHPSSEWRRPSPDRSRGRADSGWRRPRCAFCPGGPEQRIDQMIAGIRQDAAIRPPWSRIASCFPLVRGCSTRAARERPSPVSPVRSRRRRAGAALRSGSGQRRNWCPTPTFEPAPACQAHDVGRLLHIGRKRLLDEHMATCLKGIHRQAVVRKVGREDRQCLRRLLAQQIAMVGEGRNGRARSRSTRAASDARSASPRADCRSGSAQPAISTHRGRASDPGGCGRPSRIRRSRSERPTYSWCPHSPRDGCRDGSRIGTCRLLGSAISADPSKSVLIPAA